MTDDEITQSKFDHFNARWDIEVLVREGTPSRIGTARRCKGGMTYYDYIAKCWRYERRRR